MRAVPQGLLPPSLSLLPAAKLTEEQVFAALRNLCAIYCPLPVSLAFKLGPQTNELRATEAPSLADSGYASGAEDDGDGEGTNEDGDFTIGVHSAASIYTDAFERSVAERWLTSFLARAHELPCFAADDSARQRAVDQACCVLESLYASAADRDHRRREEEEAVGFPREFSFHLRLPKGGSGQEPEMVPLEIRLNDGLAGANSEDPDDVGLQSWGAAIVLSELLCATPDRFGFTARSASLSPRSPARIVELGAGTGLVSLVLAAALPHLGLGSSTVVATDYHPAVLANLQSNIANNNQESRPRPSVSDSEGRNDNSRDSNNCHATPLRVETAPLDWSHPESSLGHPPLHTPADILVATDVVYAAEHAEWLRGCAGKLLAPDGVFWLLVTVRPNGRFSGISETVEAVFAPNRDGDGNAGRERRLVILGTEWIDKKRGIGRGDESGYKMYRIGWT
ncbi:hypothetical protein VTK73DRAFT_9204 [Phialemonium thermophilum]|uniref:S-adenosylmethionine-dependent methyltransferase n=1 Tax=Phialemonium thermophilum TaxID=223376 RepID=A0ABR3XLH2_9PEZI